MNITKYTPIIDRSHPAGMGGTQQVYRFANGYGASVVHFFGSYGYEDGKYEIAVVKFDGDDYKLTSDTPVTNDVIGYVDPSDVDRYLDQIAELPTP